MIKERWLEDFGFKVGQRYNVDCQNKKLFIQLKVQELHRESTARKQRTNTGQEE